MAKGKTKKTKNTAALTATLCAVGFAGLFLLLFNVNRYAFVDVLLFPLWYVALGLGVISGALLALKCAFKGLGIWASIGVFALTAFLVFVMMGFIFAHANHIFDRSEPERYTVEIEDKSYRSGGRRRQSAHEFTVTVNGYTFDIDVPMSDYYALEEGDLYIVEYHRGAFHVPYYIGVGVAE